MRRRVLLSSTLAGLALALSFGIEAALASNADPQLATLTVSIAGTGSGRVVGEGTSCPGICSAQFPVGSFVDLHVTPAAPTVTAWTVHGADCRRPLSDKPFRGCILTLTGDTSARFTFNLVACDVPNVRGKTLAAAKTTMRSHDCGVGKITHEVSRTVRKGHVISQKPKPGTQRRQGAKVNLVVSK